MRFALFSLVLGLALVGCGKAYQGLSDRCSSEFVSDYNRASNNVALKAEFKQKYRGARCKALMTSSSRLSDQETYIDVDSM